MKNDSTPQVSAGAPNPGVGSSDLFGSFDVVAFVDAVRKETSETRQGAVGMWGLETATSMFIGQKLMAEAHRRLLNPNNRNLTADENAKE